MACASSVARVYPRVGGGTDKEGGVRCRYPGLSPRGRGNLLLGLGIVPRFRSIPAWAGEPSSASSIQ